MECRRVLVRYKERKRKLKHCSNCMDLYMKIYICVFRHGIKDVDDSRSFDGY